MIAVGEIVAMNFHILCESWFYKCYVYIEFSDSSFTIAFYFSLFDEWLDMSLEKYLRHKCKTKAMSIKEAKIKTLKYVHEFRHKNHSIPLTENSGASLNKLKLSTGILKILAIPNEFWKGKRSEWLSVSQLSHKIGQIWSIKIRAQFLCFSNICEL